MATHFTGLSIMPARILFNTDYKHYISGIDNSY